MTEEFHLEPGIYESVPWSDYVRIPYMSPSTLKHGLRSMRRLKRAIDGEIYPSAKTVAVGQVVHCLIAGEHEERIAVMPDYHLDPDNLTAGTEKKPPASMFVKSGDLSAAGRKWAELCVANGFPEDHVLPFRVDREQTTSKTTNYVQAKVEEFGADNEGMDIITEADHQRAKDVVSRLMAHKHCAELIQKSKQEITVIGEIEGVKVKTRLDGFWKEGHTCGCWDLKTTSDIAPDVFYRLCKKFGYLFQFGFHNAILATCGVQLQCYDVIGAEVQDDFDVGVIQIQPFELLDDWADKVRELLAQYRICRSKDEWPGLYDDKGEQGVLCVPNWDMKDANYDWKEIDND
tara:strand:- start:7515 stop:8552 length:1038 start_codon:yes stop_codon:yes gene_type:complete